MLVLGPIRQTKRQWTSWSKGKSTNSRTVPSTPVRKAELPLAGKWKNEMRHGYGVQTWTDGARYEGMWENNKTCGKGKFWHSNGDFFEGTNTLA